MHARTVLLLALLGSVALAGVATSAPPPERFCGLCTEDFDGIAAENGLDVTAEASTMTVHVFSNGSTRWREHVVLRSADGGGVEASQERLEGLGRAARESRYVLVDDPESIEVAFDGRTLTATYWVEGATSRQAGGVVLFEGFHTEGRSTTMQADRITVRGPAGTRVANRVPGATLDGRTATWTAGERYSAPGAGTYVAFSPGDGLLGKLAGALAVGVVVGPSMFRDAVFVGGPASVAVLLVAGATRTFRRRPGSDRILGYTLSTLAVFTCAGSSLVVVASVALGVGTLEPLGFVAIPLAVVGVLSTGDRRVSVAAALLIPASIVTTALTFVPVGHGLGVGLHTLVYSVVVAGATGPILLGYAGRELLWRRSGS